MQQGAIKCFNAYNMFTVNYLTQHFSTFYAHHHDDIKMVLAQPSPPCSIPINP